MDDRVEDGVRDRALALPTCHFSCSVSTCKTADILFASVLWHENVIVCCEYSLLTKQIVWCLFLGNNYFERMLKDLSCDKMTIEIHCWEI